MESELLTCPNCLEKFDQSTHLPRILLICGHTICSACLTTFLASPDQARCPLDSEIIFSGETNIEQFPVNFIAQFITEKRKEKDKELCESHGEKIRFLCLTDRLKVCDKCICLRLHEGHKLKTTKEINGEANARRTEIEGLLEVQTAFYKETTRVIEEKRQSLLKNLKDNFQEMMTLLTTKELEMTCEINTFFNLEQNRVNQMIGCGSALRDSMYKQVTGLKNIFKNEEFLKNEKFLEETQNSIAALSVKLNPEGFHKEIQGIKDELEKMIQSVNLYFSRQIGSLSQIELSFNDFLKDFAVYFTEDGMDNFEWKPVNNLHIKTTLGFRHNGNCLEILSESLNPKETLLEVDKWNNVEELSLELKHGIAEEEDVKALVYVFKRLQAPKTLKIKCSPTSISDKIIHAIMTLPRSFSNLEMNLANYPIYENQKGILLIEKAVCRLNCKPKSIDFNLTETKLTDKTLKIILGEITDTFKDLEAFTLRLAKNNVTDQSVKELFVPMPNIKSLCLSLEGTSITGESIKAFELNTFPTMTNLEVLKLSLVSTKISGFTRLPPLRSQNFKKFYLDLGQTQITDEGLENLAYNIAPMCPTIEEFALGLKSNKISNKGVLQFFQEMPNLRYFCLGLCQANVDDEVLIAIAEKTLPSTNCLESFTVWTGGTKITDIGVEKILTNIKDVKRFIMDVKFTTVSDKSIEPFLNEKIDKMTNLGEFDIIVFNSQVSNQIQGKIAKLKRKFAKKVPMMNCNM